MIEKNMSKVLVTGGKGLVGSALNENFIKVGRKYDLTKQKQVDYLFKKYTPDHVIHTAGKVGGVGGNSNFQADYFYENVCINTNVINACKKYNVKRLIAFTSTCVFPESPTYPLTEDQIHLGPPHKSNYGYAYAKRMTDIQIRAYNEQYNLSYFTVIPCNIYGPNDNFNIDNGHVIPSLIHKAYLAKKNKTNLEIWGTGTPLREFIFSKDVAKIVEILLKNYDKTTPVIISSDTEISIKDLVDIIIKKIDFNGKVVYNVEQPDGQYKKPSDNSRMKKYINEFEFTSIEDGIEETINWFLENYGKARK